LPQLAAALLLPDEPPDEPPELDDDPDEPEDPLLEPAGLDPPDESDDPPEPAVAATFLSPVAPALSPLAGLSPDPFDAAVLVAAALESVR
jgi:hypothetical protein